MPLSKDASFSFMKQLAEPYDTRRDFWKAHPQYARRCAEMGWLDRIYPRIRRKHLTHDVAMASASKFKTRHEFIATDPAAYQWFIKAGRMSELDERWPPKVQKTFRFPRNHTYTFDECVHIVQDCRSRSCFKNKYAAACQQARKNGWFPKLPFIDNMELRSERRLYTYDDIIKAASQYDSPSQFYKSDPSRYGFAQRYGILKDLKWRHLDIEVLENGFTDTVYAYEFPRYRTVYVGRSVHPNKRHIQHHVKDDVVARFASEHHVQVPPMTIIYSGLSPLEGARREAFTLQMYIDLGWNPLNTAKPGSLGMLNAGKLTKNFCMKVAAQYDTLIDLITYDASVYDKLRRTGSLDECHWLKRKCNLCPAGSWATCPKKLVQEEAAKYNTVKEFRIHNQAAYLRCRSEKWLWTFFKKPVPWKDRPIEDVVAEAAKYDTPADFRKHSPAAHAIARNAGMLQTLFPDQKRKPNPLARHVIRMDLEGNILSSHRSINDAARAIGLPRDNGAICHACHGSTDTAYGYRFRFDNAPME